MVLRTVTEMQNDVGLMSQIVIFQFIFMFPNHFTKMHYNFYENTSISKKYPSSFSCLALSAPVAMAAVYKY